MHKDLFEQSDDRDVEKILAAADHDDDKSVGAIPASNRPPQLSGWHQEGSVGTCADNVVSGVDILPEDPNDPWESAKRASQARQQALESTLSAVLRRGGCVLFERRSRRRRAT